MTFAEENAVMDDLQQVLHEAERSYDDHERTWDDLGDDRLMEHIFLPNLFRMSKEKT